MVGVGGEEEHHFLPTSNSMSVASAVDLVIIHALVVGGLARFVWFSIFILPYFYLIITYYLLTLILFCRMAQFHLLDPFYDESHRGRLLAEGQVFNFYYFCRIVVVHI